MGRLSFRPFSFRPFSFRPATVWLNWRGLRARRWRALALVLLLAVTTTAFTVLCEARNLLLVILLLECVLAVAHAMLAATDALAPELRQQAALGLLPADIRRHLLAGVVLLALAAGLVSALAAGLVSALAAGRVSALVPGLVSALAAGRVSALVAGLAGVPGAGPDGAPVAGVVAVTPLHALLAVPLAAVLGILGAVVPAWRAAEAAHSARPPRRPPGHLHARGRMRAAVVQVRRTPGRSGIVLAVVAIATACLTVRGGVRDDGAVVVLIVLTAAYVVADAAWLAGRDRGAELADLRVQGLLGSQVAGVVAREMSIPVVLGSALGVVAGLALAQT